MTNDNNTKKWILISFLIMFFGLFIFGAISLGLADPKREKDTGENITEVHEHDETLSQIKSDNPLRDEGDNDFAKERKSIIIYYSLSGTTEKVAKYIKEKTGFELVKLETHKTYPKDDEELMQLEIDNEKANFIYPKLKNNLELGEYDVVYLGFPIWYSDLARPIYTLLQDYDFSGMTIVPFVCSDNYGQGNTVSLISKMEPGAIVINNPLAITNYNRNDYKSAVDSWIPQVNNAIAQPDMY